ncbi:MAG: thioesterase domain-containing protein [Pseudomonadota bacterium]
MSDSSHSIVRRGGRTPTGASKRLFCLPPAGAGATLYYSWFQHHINQDIEICPLALPGREDRIKDPLPASIEDLAEQLVDSIKPELNREYALFGYSMGSLIAYELILQLQANGLPYPQYFFSLAARAPNRPMQNEKPLHTLAKNEFHEVLHNLGGTPKEILNNDAAMEIFGPILRNDFRISETYLRQDVKKLSCPILAIHCAQDVLINQIDVTAWKEYTSNQFDLHVIDDAHIISQERFKEFPQLVEQYWI